MKKYLVVNGKKIHKGTNIKCIFMDDFQAPPTGTKGVVDCIDDCNTIHVHWENGSSLGLIIEEDEFEILD